MRYGIPPESNPCPPSSNVEQQPTENQGTTVTPVQHSNTDRATNDADDDYDVNEPLSVQEPAASSSVPQEPASSRHIPQPSTSKTRDQRQELVDEISSDEGTSPPAKKKKTSSNKEKRRQKSLQPCSLSVKTS